MTKQLRTSVWFPGSLLFGVVDIASAQDISEVSGNWISDDGRKLTINLQPPRLTIQRVDQVSYDFDLNVGTYIETFENPRLGTSTKVHEVTIDGPMILLKTRSGDPNSSWRDISIIYSAGPNRLGVTGVYSTLGGIVPFTMVYTRQ